LPAEGSSNLFALEPPVPVPRPWGVPAAAAVQLHSLHGGGGVAFRVSWKRQSCPVFERTPKPIEAAPEPEPKAEAPKTKPPLKRRTFAAPGNRAEKAAPPTREVR
jgi:hypothetical protein